MQQLGGLLGWLCTPQLPHATDDAAVDDTDAAVDAAVEVVDDDDDEVDHGAERRARAAVPLTPDALRAGMDATATGVLPFDARRFRRVKQLQEAKRNQGCVELMREGGSFVAVKKMPTRWVRRSPDEFDAQYPDASERPWVDVGILRRLNEIGYPYTVKLLGVFADSESTYVVSSLASEGDLFAWCDCDPTPGPGREEVMYPLAREIFAGVRWLHDLGIAHRDLSLENLLVHSESEGLRIKIIDFGMATLKRSVFSEVRGKQSYQAPEIYQPHPFDTFMADTFSLGVVLFAMAAQDYPWSSTKRKACELFEYVCTFGLLKFLSKRRVRKGCGESLADVFSPSFTALLLGLLAKDAGKRLTLGEKCFETAENGHDARRATVWDCKWMQ